MAHSYSNLLYHIVFGTSERRPLIDEVFQPRLYEYLGGTIRGLKGTCLEVGGVEDHMHILVRLPPIISVSDFMEKLKSNSLKRAKSVRRRLRMAARICGFHCERIAIRACCALHSESARAS